MDPRAVPASPAAPTRMDEGAVRGKLRETRALAPYTHGGGKGCPAPLGPDGSRAQGCNPARLGPVRPTRTRGHRGLPPSGAYPGAVVAHHHLPALAVHRPPGREPPLPRTTYSQHLLQPPPGAFLFLLRLSAAAPRLQLSSLTGSRHGPGPARHLTDGQRGKGGDGKEAETNSAQVQ